MFLYLFFLFVNLGNVFFGIVNACDDTTPSEQDLIEFPQEFNSYWQFLTVESQLIFPGAPAYTQQPVPTTDGDKKKYEGKSESVEKNKKQVQLRIKPKERKKTKDKVRQKQISTVISLSKRKKDKNFWEKQVPPKQK